MRSFDGFRAGALGPFVPDLFDLSNPNLNRAKLAEGMVSKVTSALRRMRRRAFEDCIKRKGPQLIEAIL